MFLRRIAKKGIRTLVVTLLLIGIIGFAVYSVFPGLIEENLPALESFFSELEKLDSNPPSITLNENFTAADIPEYDGEIVIEVNGNMPFFNDGEKAVRAPYEYYSPLDNLGRCGVTHALLNKSLMPTEPRESISHVYPSGWEQGKYDFVDGKYLYNRCHLIGFQLAGENDTKENLITATRTFNLSMLPYENSVASFVRKGGEVLYRVTPIYNGNDLVATGVLMESLPVSGSGAKDEVTFCIFVYNVEPGVEINYSTGENWLAEETSLAIVFVDKRILAFAA